MEEKLGELVHINAQPQERLIEQTKQISESEMLMKQLQEKAGAYESLLHQIQNQEVERSKTQAMGSQSKEADNGAVLFDWFQYSSRSWKPARSRITGFMLIADPSQAQESMLGAKLFSFTTYC